MHESKMCQMFPHVEHQRANHHSKRWLRMPLLLKRGIKKVAVKAGLFLVKIGISVFAAWLISLWAIPAAYAERGYPAAGGEWLLILAVGALAYWAAARWLDIRIKTRKGGPRIGNTL